MLVQGTGTSKNTVLRISRDLEAKGWITIDRSRGWHSHSFELCVPNGASIGTVHHPANSATDGTVSPAQTVPSRTSNGAKNTQTVPTVAPRNENLRTENRIEKEIDFPRLDLGEDSGRRSQSHSEIDSNFEQFYRQYPKHVAKAAALKAYCAVISK